MIATFSAKLAKGGPAHDVAGMIEPVYKPAQNLAELVERYGEGAFDGVYSSMGPLNCIPDLQPVADALALLVKPGGRVILGILNRYCLWETAWYLRALRPQARLPALGRPGRSHVPPRLAGRKVHLLLLEPSAPSSAPLTAFPRGQARRPALAPAPALSRRPHQARPRFFRAIARLDRRFAHWPAYDIGDHLLIQFERLP